MQAKLHEQSFKLAKPRAQIHKPPFDKQTVSQYSGRFSQIFHPPQHSEITDNEPETLHSCQYVQYRDRNFNETCDCIQKRSGICFVPANKGSVCKKSFKDSGNKLHRTCYQTPCYDRFSPLSDFQNTDCLISFVRPSKHHNKHNALCTSANEVTYR